MKLNVNRRLLKSLAVCGILTPSVLFPACTPTINQRGNFVEDYQLQSVIPDLHTQGDVLRLLGSPTSKSTFDDNTWYYIGQETTKKGILDHKISKERVITARFDNKGILQTLTERKDGRIDVPVARNKTPTYGTETTVAEEFFGNLGKFNPSQSPTQ